MKLTKRVMMLAIAIVLLFSLSACGGQSNSNNNTGTKGEGDKSQKITWGYLNVMDDAETILASRAGLYKKHGVDVEMKQFTSGTDLIKAIVGGQVDGGVLGFTNALSWIDKGSNLKIVGGAQMGFHSMLVRKDSGIDSLKQLKGKTIASQKQGSTADIVLNGHVLKSANLTRQDVNMQYVSPAVAIQSLAAGKVDAAFVFEPYNSIAMETYPVKQIYEIGNDWAFPCMVVIASGDALKNKKDAITHVLDAQKEAIDMLQNNPAKAAKYITKDFIKQDALKKADGSTVPAEKVIEAAVKSQTFNWAITNKDISRMQDITRMMVDQGILKDKLDVNKALDLSWQKQQQK